MLRIALISLVVLALLLWFAYQARKNQQQLLSVGLITLAALFVLLLVAAFSGVIGG